MASSAEIYCTHNYIAKSNGIDLIDSLVNRNNIKFCDIIVDIGCGTGNVTKILSQKIPHNRILAFDISSEMTEMANKNFSSDSIEYLTEDISKPWNQLIPELKALESKVSLIFSNQVLNFIEDKETAVENIIRLLKVNGNICVNIVGVIDVTLYLRPDLRQKMVKIPDIEEQYKMWKHYFIKKGIVLTYSHIKQYECSDKKDIIEGIYPMFVKFYQMYVKSKLLEDREKVMSDPEVYKAMVNLRMKAIGEEYKSDAYQKFDESGEQEVNFNLSELRFIGIQAQDYNK